MIAYRPPQYHPGLAQVVVPAAAPAVVSTTAGTPFPQGLLWTALAAAAAWAAIETARDPRTKGFKQVAAWAGGVAAALAALTGITSVVAPSVAPTLPFRWYYT